MDGRDDIDERREELKAFVRSIEPRLYHEASGRLRHPYLDPGAEYSGQLWDWDAFFSGVALARMGTGHAAIRGCVSNFVDHIRDDGSVPYQIAADPNRANPLSPANQPRDRRPPESAFNSAKPLLAQMAVIGAADHHDDWLRSVASALSAHIRHWEETQLSDRGLFVWRSHRGSGPDNHPALYGRPENSVAGADLNSLMFREYQALAVILDRIGDRTEADQLEERAAALARRMQDMSWDPVDGFFYHVDVLSRTPPNTNQQVTWVTPLKYRTWTSFYPLWAGVATDVQAETFVRACIDDGGIVAPYGVRSLSRRDPLYSVHGSSNPSNWQGPVWLVSNYIAFAGLLNYGYTDLARDIADASVRLLSDDLRRSGRMHECYDPDTGEGIINPGFVNWNLLAAIMHDQLDEQHAKADDLT